MFWELSLLFYSPFVEIVRSRKKTKVDKDIKQYTEDMEAGLLSGEEKGLNSAARAWREVSDFAI
jgi:hypothetical protein